MTEEFGSGGSSGRPSKGDRHDGASRGQGPIQEGRGGAGLGRPGQARAGGGSMGGARYPSVLPLRDAAGKLRVGPFAFSIAMGCQLPMMVGAFGTWTTFLGIPVSGKKGDGVLVFVLGLIALALCVLQFSGKVPPKALWALVCADGLAAAIAIYDAGKASGALGTSIGSGLVTVLLFSVISTAAALVAAIRTR